MRFVVVAALALTLAVPAAAWAKPPDPAYHIGTAATHSHRVGYGMTHFDGAGPERWRWRYLQTRRELARVKRENRRLLNETFWTPLERAFLCIHRHEGAWGDTGSPYYGGLQMDMEFQRTYGPEFLRWFGTADDWPVSVQLAVAIRAHQMGRGFGPWPNTARYCGLLP